MYVCLCNGVTEAMIVEAVGQGARDLAHLTMMTGVASNCGSCAEMAEAILHSTQLSARAPWLGAAMPVTCAA
ncbi:MAG: (2Fe-2S)-binding protein [Xanthomonadales bacterium]|nr:(2Fe-2S)-binding protein [Xanthomonadales bacterium]